MHRMCAIFGPPTAWAMAAIVIWAEYAWYKVVPFGETEANSSDRPIQSTSGSPWDLVMEMGVLDLTGLGVKEPLFRAARAPANGAQWFGSEVGNVWFGSEVGNVWYCKGVSVRVRMLPMDVTLIFLQSCVLYI